MAQLSSILDTSFKVPRAFIKVSLGVGARSPGSGAMKCLVVGSMTSAGSAAVSELKLIAGEEDAKTYFGAGSELHLAARAFFKANPIGVLYGVAVDDSTGGGVATKTFVFTGTATADGSVEAWINGERVAISVVTGDTATVVGDKLAAVINGRSDLPVTAANVTGTVTVSAKNKGTRFNWITTRSLKTGAAGITHTPTTGKTAGGTDTGANPTTQLDAVAGAERFHLIFSGFLDSTNLGKFKTSLTSLAQPITGKRGRWLACSPDTLANAITLSDGLNDPRGELIWMEAPDALPIEVAGAYAGAHTAKRSSDRAANTDGMALPSIKTRYAIADRPTISEQNTALNNGLTPIRDEAGTAVSVRSVTNYHQDGSGNDDFTILDTHYVEVADFIGDAIEQGFSTTFAGFKLGVDGEDGAPPFPGVATPKSVKDWLVSILYTYEGRLVVNVKALTPSIVVEADTNTPGRLNAEVPVDCIELFHQLGTNVAQVG